MNQKTLKVLNEFKQKYLSLSYRVDWKPQVKFSGTSKDHQRMVFDICWWLYQNNIPFMTEAVFKSGYNPDIICPTHVRPIIEVRHSEGDKQTLSKFKRIPDELQDKIIYVDAGEDFVEELIL